MLIDTNSRKKNDKFTLDKIINILSSFQKSNNLLNRVIEIYKAVKSMYVSIFEAKKENIVVEENRNVKVVHEVVHDEGCTGKNFCKKDISKSVIKLTVEFSEKKSESKNTPHICEQKKMYNLKNDEKYIVFVDFIFSISKGKKLPTNAMIDKHVGIGKRERDKFRDRAVEEGIITKINSRVFELNKDHKLYIEYLERSKGHENT